MHISGSAVERGNLQMGSSSSPQFLPFVKTQYWTLGLGSTPELAKAGGFGDCWHLMMSLSNQLLVYKSNQIQTAGAEDDRNRH